MCRERRKDVNLSPVRTLFISPSPLSLAPHYADLAVSVDGQDGRVVALDRGRADGRDEGRRFQRHERRLGRGCTVDRKPLHEIPHLTRATDAGLRAHASGNRPWELGRMDGMGVLGGAQGEQRSAVLRLRRHPDGVHAPIPLTARMLERRQPQPTPRVGRRTVVRLHIGDNQLQDPVGARPRPDQRRRRYDRAFA